MDGTFPAFDGLNGHACTWQQHHLGGGDACEENGLRMTVIAGSLCALPSAAAAGMRRPFLPCCVKYRGVVLNTRCTRTRAVTHTCRKTHAPHRARPAREEADVKTGRKMHEPKELTMRDVGYTTARWICTVYSYRNVFRKTQRAWANNSI